MHLTLGDSRKTLIMSFEIIVDVQYIAASPHNAVMEELKKNGYLSG
jgi:hypothetical protein